MDAVKIYTRSEFNHDPQYDSAFKLIFILSGELSIYVGSKQRHLNTHDFTFIRPFELHGGSSGLDVCTALILDISPDLWEHICPGAVRINFSISILRSNDRIETYHSICSNLAQIIHYTQTSGNQNDARICRCVSDIIAILLEQYSTGYTSERQSDQTSARIQDILRYIVSNYSRKMSLEEIAGNIGFHPQYFSAYFKKQFGVSFTDYLNSYRVNKSIPLLTQSNESILNIALACGFNNHKTYSNAFEKYYGCPPREYRKAQRLRVPAGEVPFTDDGFDFLREFWNKNQPDSFPSNLRPRNKCDIRIDGTVSSTGFCNQSRNFVSIGRALSLLRSDMRKQLLRAKQDLNLEFVRIRDVFSDDLSVYYEDSNHTPVFSFRALDEILDFLVNADLKPFIEIGYMPEHLASKKQYAGWQYRPNVSYPKSMKLWEQLVAAFISHLISRYGKETVESWLFDFWTSPNLDLAHGYWNESMDSFFRFYRTSFHVLKKIDSQIRMGSPNFSFPTGFKYYSQFLKYVSDHGIAPDFISTHLYGCGDGESNPAEAFIQYSVFDNNYRIPNIRPNRNNIYSALDELRSIVENSPYRGLPIIVDDWNVSFFPTDFTRDTGFMGPFVIENYFNSCSKVFGMGFASLSDIHEDFFNTDQMFNGGPGLLTYTGIPKSSYYAMSMAYRFSRKILSKGDNYIVGKTDFGYELLLYNMDYYNDDYVGNDPSVISFTKRYNVFEQVPDLDFHIELSVSNGSYSITRSLLSVNTGSSYDTWVKIGSPADITPEIARYLDSISIPEIRYETVNSNGRIMIDEILEPHSVLHIEISRQ